jgi:fructose-1,6-bisphosphatase/inositol monophosphatase family enzyme
MVRISESHRNDLEIAARGAVVAGGFTAMGYYRGALAIPTVLEKNLSPSTIADVQATLAILRSLDPPINHIAGKMNLGFSLFAEELEKSTDNPNDEIEERVKEILEPIGGIRSHIKRTTEEFRDSFETCIAILFDALDGTTNFRAGIPLFCSAIAFFIHGQPRVGAIYDPLHNVVYYGSLHDEVEAENRAYAWQVQAGNLSNLVDIKQTESPKRLIATHLTRSKEGKRNEMMSKLSALSASSEGTYMINSGQLALAYVATGNLSAFINNYTNIWDVAAGEVLIRAVGGKVTDFAGKDIDYRGGSKVDIVASSNQTLHEEILMMLRENN